MLVIVFGAYAIADGITALIVGASGDAGGKPWWQMILVGLVSILAGVLTFLWPAITAVALLACIAAWAIVGGALEIIAAIRLRAIIDHEWLLILAGICSILFGAILLARPLAGALAVMWIIGSYALVFGCLFIVLAFRLRSMKKTLTGAGSGLTPAMH